MKNLFKICLGVGLVAVVVSSCRKSENFPVSKVSINYVFDPRDSAGTNALAYLLQIYSIVPYGNNRVSSDYLDAASDDAVSSVTGDQVTTLAEGTYTSVNLPSGENLWSNTNSTNTANFWNGIRDANEFIANIGVVPVKDVVDPTTGKINGIGVSKRYIWRNEARFLRAYFYFELVKRFGGVPLLGNTVYNINDNLNFSRSSFSDCINYIVSECDAVKDSLIIYNQGADNYRVSKGTALALKAKVLLYAASPLFNDPTGGNSNALAGYTDYDVKRWQLAQNAAKDVMNMGIYSLDPVFKNVFLTQDDPETIYVRTTGGPSNNVETNNGPIGYSSALGHGITSPTQQLVNAFPMTNGLDITDPSSGYDANNPYNNRDPRLAMTVLTNGAAWLGGTLQTYEGGVSKPNNGSQQTLTGYYLHKFMGYDETGTTFTTHDEDWVVFRYAEILLYYAEAENEFSGPSSDVYAQLEAIRNRAGIASGSGTYGLAPNMTQAEMRAAIQNEERCEFAFEEHRFFDIRRWKIAETVMNQPLTGVSINNAAGALTYNYVTVLQPHFIAPKMYLYPIPYDEVLKDPNLKQNTGW